jgi:AAA family ATP:ADP antiporter
MILMSQVYSTVTMLAFQDMIFTAIPNSDQQTSYSGMIFAIINIISLVLQLVGSPLILSRVPLISVHILIPLMNLSLISWAVLSPSLTSISTAFVIFKAMDYSIFRASKEIFYIPLPFDVRYRSKELIDVFGYRFGKGATSAGITAAQWLGFVFTPVSYAFVGFGALCLWSASILSKAKFIHTKDVTSKKVLS